VGNWLSKVFTLEAVHDKTPCSTLKDSGGVVSCRTSCILLIGYNFALSRFCYKLRMRLGISTRKDLELRQRTPDLVPIPFPSCLYFIFPATSIQYSVLSSEKTLGVPDVRGEGKHHN
jgi:hypothetical protein